MDTMLRLWKMPNAQGRNGIHISAQLRVNAMQLADHGIGWAASTMETAAARIDELENMVRELKEPTATAGLENMVREPQPMKPE